MNRWRRQRVRPVVGLVGVILGLTLVVAAPTAALVGHSGKYGVHGLIDNEEYAGALCHYNSGSGLLDQIKVRRPIVYAYDRTAGVDTQTVGWRFNVEYSIDGTNWSTWNNSTIRAAKATDKVDAPFRLRAYNLVNQPKTTYWRVTIDLYWFYPDVNHAQGVASHIVNWYQIGGQVAYQTWCPQQQMKTITTPPPPGHSGNYGVHTLIDTGEYPGATCLYHNTIQNHRLYEITVRQPYVLAFDRTANPDTQTVGWQYIIQWHNGSGWHAQAMSSIIKASATDAVNAAFQPRSYTFPSAPTHPYYRVVVRMFWYYPGATNQDGLATHSPADYRLKGPGFSSIGMACANSVAP